MAHTSVRDSKIRTRQERVGKMNETTNIETRATLVIPGAPRNYIEGSVRKDWRKTALCLRYGKGGHIAGQLSQPGSAETRKGSWRESQGVGRSLLRRSTKKQDHLTRQRA